MWFEHRSLIPFWMWDLSLFCMHWNHFCHFWGSPSQQDDMIFRSLWLFIQTSWKRWVWARSQHTMALSSPRKEIHHVLQDETLFYWWGSSFFAQPHLLLWIFCLSAKKYWYESNGRTLEILGRGVQSLVSRTILSNRTVYNDGNVLYFCSSLW